MHFKSKKTSLLILGLTAIVCSRVMLLSFNDPEGPNLLVVMGMAVIIYFLSLTVYLFDPSTKHLSRSSFTDIKRLLLAIFTQIVIVTSFYFWLK